jgi:hypothetical protein
MRCEQTYLDPATLDLKRCEREATGPGLDENGEKKNLCDECFIKAERRRGRKDLLECGHPKMALVERKGEDPFCSICEAEARIPLAIGLECCVCGKAIEGSYYQCCFKDGKDVCFKCHGKMPNHLCICISDNLPTTGLSYSYDEDNDVLTIEGVKYAGDIFRTLGLAPVGTTIRIEGREDGVVAVRRIDDEN